MKLMVKNELIFISELIPLTREHQYRSHFQILSPVTRYKILNIFIGSFYLSVHSLLVCAFLHHAGPLKDIYTLHRMGTMFFL